MKILIASILLSLVVHAKLLDKITAVINDKIITESEINRILSTIPARREISTYIYNKENYIQKDVISLIFQTYIVRDKLTALGYVITDDAVESRIQMTEKKLGLRREDLLEFLKAKNITFDEYFELMRESMEFNIFISKIIHPLVAITDQEIKNTFYKSNDANTLSFTYHLIDYSINKSNVADLNDFKDKVKNFTITGIIPDNYKNFEALDLGTSKEEELNKEISKNLKNVGEGEFSKPILLGDSIHVFFIKKKDLAESTLFLKNKQAIYEDIFNKKSDSVKKSWIDREISSYYTKIINK